MSLANAVAQSWAQIALEVTRAMLLRATADDRITTEPLEVMEELRRICELPPGLLVQEDLCPQCSYRFEERLDFEKNQSEHSTSSGGRWNSDMEVLSTEQCQSPPGNMCP